MDVSSLTNEDKFYKILHLLLKFNVQLNDLYLIKIIDQLSKEDNFNLNKDGITINWIQIILNEYENGNKADVNTFCLAIHLTNLMCKCEKNLLHIESKQIFEKFALLIKKYNELQVITVKLSFTKLLKHLINSLNGLKWINQWKIWHFCFDFNYICNYSQILLREQASFILDLLIKLEEQHQYNICLNIVETMITPLMNKEWFDSSQHVVRLNDPKTKVKILKFHQFMENFFLDVINRRKKLVSCYLLLIKCSYQNRGWETRDVSIEITYVQQLLRTEIAADFVRLVFMEIPNDDKVAKPLSFEKFTINFFNYIYFCTERVNPHNVLVVSEYVGRLWTKLGNMQPDDVLSHSNLKFGDQILMIQLMPILHVIKERAKEETEYLDKFCLKLFYISCEYTTRHLYAIQEVLRLSGKCVLDLACKSIKSLVQSEGLLTNERAILVFQALIYCLSEFLPVSPTSTQSLELEKQNLLSTLLSGLYSLVKNYQITWKKCIESSTLVNISLALLTKPHSSKISVQVLNLIQISIEHFLSPNMALLMDNLDGGLENLGPSIINCLGDEFWEVRDSTIQLVNSIICISKAKYLTFQDMILNNNILPKIIEMACNDTEEYVRANAFKCIKYSAEIKTFWNQISSTKNLLVELVNVIFYNENEALVKREAVNALSSIYTHVGISKETAGLCFSVMAYICVNDFDWQVKINGLEFWKIVLDQIFHAQGWIRDGFPSIIFTGEQKKIVHNTPNEICHRLNTILSAYQYYGGLGVLVTCVNDKSDLIVAEKSLSIILMLKSRLEKYGYIEKRLSESQEFNTNDTTLDKVTVFPIRKNYIPLAISNNISTPIQGYIDKQDILNCGNSDKIIDDIVKQTDINILLNALENMHVQHDADEKNRIDENLYMQFAKITEIEFLNIITNNDLRELNKKRREWLASNESLSNLLEDVINSFIL